MLEKRNSGVYDVSRTAARLCCLRIAQIDLLNTFGV